MRVRKRERRERDPGPLAPLFVCFFLPLSLPYVNWAGVLFVPPEVLTQVLDLPLFYFRGLFPSLSFSHLLFWSPVSYSNYPTLVSLSFNPRFLFCSSIFVVLENEDWESGNCSSVCVRDARGSLGERMREGAAPGSSPLARSFLPGSLSVTPVALHPGSSNSSFCFLPL